MDQQQAGIFVSNTIDNFKNSPLVVNVDNKSFSITDSELGFSFDKQKTLNRLMEIGRSGEPASIFVQRLILPFRPVNISPSYAVDYDLFSQNLSSKLSSFEKAAKDASIDISGAKPVIVDEITGKVIDESLLADNLKADINNLSHAPIKAEMIEIKPIIAKEQAQKALVKVNELNARNINLVYGYDKWNLTGESLLSILQFQPTDYEDGSFMSLNLGSDIYIKTASIDSASPPELDLSLNQQKLDAFIADIATSVNKPTVNATLKFENGKITQFQPAQDGQKLDVLQTKNLLLSKVSIENIDEAKNINIDLPVHITKAEIANPEVNSLGIKDLIGRGVSYYAGSIPNRIFNIGLGASLISGTLVPPGETFSFDKLVGPVSAAQGFKQAYVISSGRTVLDDGGGICQVSTTVFRAALNAGFPILERTAHAYRVGYYEQRGFGAGLDATIWSPSVDLKFKNDTEKHILIQAVMDPANAKIEVDIYGTLDGRRVEISDPIITSQVPPPPPLYQDDPSLPKGTVKQVDFAAWGAKSAFTQKVYKGDQLVIDKAFYSNFKPWQAVFLVGTG